MSRVRWRRDSCNMDTVHRLLQTLPSRIHLVGVSGSGMIGLANLLLRMGHRVTGSDLKESAAVRRLRDQGLGFYLGHEMSQVSGSSLLVYSSAVRPENPERQAARAAGVPEIRRATLLAALSREKKSVLVCGTHGKTTTTAMLASALREAGMDPSYYVGADVPALGESADWGGGEHFIIEADESDGSFLELAAHACIVLNIEAEHLDYFRDEAAVKEAFAARVASVSGPVCYCIEDHNASEICAKAGRSISYGLGSSAEVRATGVVLDSFGSEFCVEKEGAQLGVIRLEVPGRHNVSNATGAVAVALALGAEFSSVAAGLSKFRGARRRFDVRYRGSRVVVDDYAHHPSEIRATLLAARGTGAGRVVAAFQPHRYSRTQLLRDEFSTAFQEADRLVISDVYSSGEKPIPGVSGQTVADAVRVSGQHRVTYHPHLGSMAGALLRESQPGDLIVLMGAGDINRVAERVASALALHDALTPLVSEASKLIPGEELSKHTTFRIGGPADLWCEPADERDLAAILSYCHTHGTPLTVLGRGSNVLVRDGGIRGVVLSLGSEYFQRVSIHGTRVDAGAGVRLGALVAAARKAGLGGIEFMEGIPASVGGALRMNAGAMGGWTFERVRSVRVAEMDGTIHDRPTDEFGAQYREVPGMVGRIALGASFELLPAKEEQIATTLKEYSGKRWTSQPAMPSAGCIFKNPESCPAGKLVDELGLKNRRRGGARVSVEHGNFIVNDGGATAADVLGLIAEVQAEVRAQRGVEMETEVIILGDNE